jgi:hypothetical protein
VLEHLSRGARVHSAYWNVNALSALSCAACGHLLTTFEGLSPDSRTGADICVLDDELDPLYAAALAIDGGHRAAMMAIVERRSGVRLEDGWLAADTRPAIVLPERAPARALGWPAAPGAFFDPELESAVRLAPAAARDALIGELLERMAAVERLGAEPEIAAALSAFAAGAKPGDAGYAPVAPCADRLRDEQRRTAPAGPVRTDRAWRRARAAGAVWLALLPPAHTPSPVHALQEARLVLGDDWLAARTALRSHLRRATG